jgi:hypothetical protein
MKRKLETILLVLAATLAAPGCGPGFAVKTPDGFVELDDQEEYAYRATSAEGVVLGVRAEPNRPKGNLGFWTNAIDLKLRRSGYEAVDAKEIKTKSGATGKQIRYTRMIRMIYDRPLTYWMTVFVTDADVFVVEAGGDARDFEKSKDAITTAIESFKP